MSGHSINKVSTLTTSSLFNLLLTRTERKLMRHTPRDTR